MAQNKAHSKECVLQAFERLQRSVTGTFNPQQEKYLELNITIKMGILQQRSWERF